jgi:hypothetical protein
MTADQAHRIYTILVERLDASEGDRDAFVYHMVKGGCREWRFQGCLGFGGKLYNDHKLRVDCYPEDKTDERQNKIDAVNEQLKGFE